ncbi:MAG: hypothetical protein ACPG7F_00300 [Aggregatilineales bacterium]
MNDATMFVLALSVALNGVLIVALLFAMFGMKEMIKQDALADLMSAGLKLAQGIAELTPTTRDDEALIQVEGVLDTVRGNSTLITQTDDVTVNASSAAILTSDEVSNG